jgi:hypothetical protein
LEQPNAADEMGRGPFSLLYEHWMARKFDGATDEALELQERLVESCRDAWRDNAGSDRMYVLYLVFDRKDPQFTDLVIDGLRTTDAATARHAAAIACAWHGLYFSLGEEGRKAFREHVRRFPENDALLPDEFRRRIEAIDGPEDRPFVGLYDEWMADDPPPDTIEVRLRESYRVAWAAGDAIDRAYVLEFISRGKDASGRPLVLDARDLIIEGLMTDDRQLAPTAAQIAEWAIAKGLDLGSDIRDILEAHVERFPHRFNLRVGAAYIALRELDRRERTSAKRQSG